MNVYAILGWLGTVLYLSNHSYIATVKNWKASIYYSVNLAAALSLVVSSWVIDSWQAVIINFFWAAISLALILHSKLRFFPLSVRWLNGPLLLLWLWILVKAVWTGQFDFALLGWSSALAFSGSYLLFSARQIPQRYYFLFNAYAAIVLLPQLWLDQHWPALALEIAWAVISILGAIHRFRTLRLID